MSSILVLDDRKVDRDLLATVLSYAGHEIRQASTGEQALSMAREARPDLIVTDILMPQMDGCEFVLRLRSDEALATLPVVFCTATYGAEEGRRLAARCGVSHVLIKPCEPEEIIRVVIAALGSVADSGGPVEIEFQREHLRVLNQKLLQKVNELEAANEEQRRLTEALQRAKRESIESLTLLETLQSTAPVGFGFVDREYRLQRLNETLAAVNGSLSVDEQLGKPVSEVVPALWPQIEPIYEHVMDSGEALVNQQIAAGDPGDRSVWLGSYYPVRVGGEIIGIGIVVIDISERSHAEEFRSVVMDNMAEGLCVCDHEGRLVFMNAAASTMLGWSEADLRGKSLHQALHLQHADGSPIPQEACPLFKAYTEATTARSRDDTFTTKDGELLPVAYSAAPLGTGENLRGAVIVFRDITDEKAAATRQERELNALTWVGRIREALDEERFVLYSQPILPLQEGLPHSQELLLRMFGRENEIIHPGEFLPSAEQYGLIAEIDRWVVTEAIGLAAGGWRVAANLSAESIGSADLLALIEAEIKSTGADPADIVFELTETALMQNTDQGEAFARRLVALGCGIALDDFGTGFGSFTYLKHLPIEYLKIDIEFVRDLTSNDANQNLVKAIVNLAKGFGQKTIAEGVEDDETLELLREYGVHFAQGSHLARPGPIPSEGQRQTPTS
jgi:PAS domain S-box-containing protein